jgi:hypothetical protein
MKIVKMFGTTGKNKDKKSMNGKRCLTDANRAIE